MVITLAALALLVLVGCVPTPKAGTIDVVGDSLTFQTFWYRQALFAAGAPAHASVIVDARPGIGYPDVLAAERKRAASGRPSILVIALGTNDAGPVDGGWAADDDQNLRTLMGAASPKACEVLVLPGYSDKPAVPSTYRVDLDSARAAMRKAASDRSKRGGPTVVADWGGAALAHPDLTGDDGIHLLATAPATPDRRVNEAAANAWTKIMWTAVAKCPH